MEKLPDIMQLNEILKKNLEEENKRYPATNGAAIQVMWTYLATTIRGRSNQISQEHLIRSSLDLQIWAIAECRTD